MLLATRLNQEVPVGLLDWATKTKKRGLTVLGLIHTLVYTTCRRHGIVTKDKQLNQSVFLELCTGKIPAIVFCPVRWLATTVAKNWNGASSIRIINENLDKLKEFGLLEFEKSRFGKVDQKSVDAETGEVRYRCSPRSFKDVNLILLLECLISLRKGLVERFGEEILPTQRSRTDNLIDIYNSTIAPFRGYFQHDSKRDIEESFADTHTVLEPHIKGQALGFLSEMVACVEGKPAHLQKGDTRERAHFSRTTDFGRYLISEGITLEAKDQVEAQDSFIEFATDNYRLETQGLRSGMRKVLLDAADKFSPFKRALQARACRIRLEKDREYFENTVHAWLLSEPAVIQRWQEQPTTSSRSEVAEQIDPERMRFKVKIMKEYLQREKSGEELPPFLDFLHNYGLSWSTPNPQHPTPDTQHLTPNTQHLTPNT